MKFSSPYHLGIGTLTLAVAVVAMAHPAPAQQVLTRGAVLGDSPVVDLADALGDPSAYAGEQVVLEGRSSRRAAIPRAARTRPVTPGRSCGRAFSRAMRQAGGMRRPPDSRGPAGGVLSAR